MGDFFFLPLLAVLMWLILLLSSSLQSYYYRLAVFRHRHYHCHCKTVSVFTVLQPRKLIKFVGFFCSKKSKKKIIVDRNKSATVLLCVPWTVADKMDTMIWKLCKNSQLIVTLLFFVYIFRFRRIEPIINIVFFLLLLRLFSFCFWFFDFR